MLDSASERRTQCRNACNTSVRGADRGRGGGTRVVCTNCNSRKLLSTSARAARRANNLIILNNTAEGSSIYTTMHDHSPTLRGSPSRCGSASGFMPSWTSRIATMTYRSCRNRMSTVSRMRCNMRHASKAYVREIRGMSKGHGSMSKVLESIAQSGEGG